jgi:hypothetical protein
VVLVGDVGTGVVQVAQVRDLAVPDADVVADPGEAARLDVVARDRLPGHALRAGRVVKDHRLHVRGRQREKDPPVIRRAVIGRRGWCMAGALVGLTGDDVVLISKE